MAKFVPLYNAADEPALYLFATSETDGILSAEWFSAVLDMREGEPLLNFEDDDGGVTYLCPQAFSGDELHNLSRNIRLTRG